MEKKMYETLLTNEECAHAIDMGNFYRVPADKRDLNYDKYFKVGDQGREKLSEFNSNNTQLLTIEQTKEKIINIILYKRRNRSLGEPIMKILVTGAKGFIGKNLIAELRNRKYEDILEFDQDTDISLLDHYTKECDFVFHLAGINRPETDEEFMKGNFGFTSILLGKLRENGNRSPILITSSIQAELDNPYGRSKKRLQKKSFMHMKKDNNSKVLIYRLPNVFWKMV